MKRDKIVNNLTERLCSNAKPAVLIVDVFCLPTKLLPGKYNLYGNSLEIQVKYMKEKNISLSTTIEPFLPCWEFPLVNDQSLPKSVWLKTLFLTAKDFPIDE